MKNQSIPSHLIETKAERRMRLQFQRENGVDLRTKAKPSKKKFNRKKERVNSRLALNAY